jgi:hypothetical protein
VLANGHSVGRVAISGTAGTVDPSEDPELFDRRPPAVVVAKSGRRQRLKELETAGILPSRQPIAVIAPNHRLAVVLGLGEFDLQHAVNAYGMRDLQV